MDNVSDWEWGRSGCRCFLYSRAFDVVMPAHELWTMNYDRRNYEVEGLYPSYPVGTTTSSTYNLFRQIVHPPIAYTYAVHVVHVVLVVHHSEYVHPCTPSLLPTYVCRPPSLPKTAVRPPYRGAHQINSRQHYSGSSSPSAQRVYMPNYIAYREPRTLNNTP